MPCRIFLQHRSDVLADMLASTSDSAADKPLVVKVPSVSATQACLLLQVSSTLLWDLHSCC